jgi:fucose permease
VSAHFLVMGLTGGVWMARIPAAKSQVHLSDGTLGLALFAVPVGLMIGAALAERLVDRAGSALLVRICGVGNCVAAVTPGFARGLPQLMAALFAIGASGGILDVATNAQGVRVEAAYGRPVMTSMHAFYSLGAILGSLAGGAFAWAGVALLPSLAVIDVAGVVIDGTAGYWLLPEAPRTALALAGAVPNEPVGPQGQLYWPDGPTGQNRLSPGAPEASPVNSPSAPSASGATEHSAEPASSGTSAAEHSARARKRVRRLVLALGVLGVCGLVGEGAAGDWSAVYLRDNLGASAGLAALGFAAFSVTMTLGRGVGDRLIHRFGVVSVIRVCGLIATAGLAFALATSVPAVAIAGFTAFGAGLSIVVPQVFAAGGRADPLRPGSGLAKVVGLGYTGMAAGPAIIGLVASKVGLHLALLIPVVLAAWIAVAATALRPGGGRAPVRDNAHPQSHAWQRRATLCTWMTKKSCRGSAS